MYQENQKFRRIISGKRSEIKSNFIASSRNFGYPNQRFANHDYFGLYPKMSHLGCKKIALVSWSHKPKGWSTPEIYRVLGAILLLRKKNSGWVGTSKCL